MSDVWAELSPESAAIVQAEMDCLNERLKRFKDWGE
jgi:hypothetical protein